MFKEFFLSRHGQDAQAWIDGFEAKNQKTITQAVIAGLKDFAWNSHRDPDASPLPAVKKMFELDDGQFSSNYLHMLLPQLPLGLRFCDGTCLAMLLMNFLGAKNSVNAQIALELQKQGLKPLNPPGMFAIWSPGQWKIHVKRNAIYEACLKQGFDHDRLIQTFNGHTLLGMYAAGMQVLNNDLADIENVQLHCSATIGSVELCRVALQKNQRIDPRTSIMLLPKEISDLLESAQNSGKEKAL